MNLDGTGGGGLDGSCCAWFGCMLVATVLQLKRLLGSCGAVKPDWYLGFRVATVSIDCLPGATEGAYVVQLK